MSTTLGWALYNLKTHKFETAKKTGQVLVWMMQDWPWQIAGQFKHLKVLAGSFDPCEATRSGRSSTAPYLVAPAAFVR